MSQDEKLDAVVTVKNFLGKDRQIFFNLKAARFYNRLTGKSLLKRFDPNDVDELIGFYLAGLLKYNPDIVGMNADGTPNEITMQTLETLEEGALDMDEQGETLSKFLECFQRSTPKKLPDKQESSEDSGKKKGNPKKKETGNS